MNLELQRQHEEHKARRARMTSREPVCRMAPAPAARVQRCWSFAADRELAKITVRSKPIKPSVAVQSDEHVKFWRRSRLPKLPFARCVILAASAAADVAPEMLIGKARPLWIIPYRHAAMYLLVKDASMSLPLAGRRLGGRHHTTVLRGCRKVRAKIEAGDRQTVDLVDAIRSAAFLRFEVQA